MAEGAKNIGKGKGGESHVPTNIADLSNDPPPPSLVGGEKRGQEPNLYPKTSHLNGGEVTGQALG